MLKYITEKEYKDLLGVQSVPSNFERLIIEAREYINAKTFGRIDENNIPEKVKFVTCLIVNNLNEKENHEKTKISFLYIQRNKTIWLAKKPTYDSGSGVKWKS